MTLSLGQTADDRGVIDHHAIPLGTELTHRGLCAIDVSEHVRLDHAAPDIRGNIFEAPKDANPGVVEPDVDPAKAGERLGSQVLDLILLRRVGLNDQRIAAKIKAFLLDFTQPVRAPGGKNNGRSPLGESMCRGTANAA